MLPGTLYALLQGKPQKALEHIAGSQGANPVKRLLQVLLVLSRESGNTVPI